MKLAIVGDFNPENKTHVATNLAIEHARKYLKLDISSEWVATESIIENWAVVTKKLFKND